MAQKHPTPKQFKDIDFEHLARVTRTGIFTVFMLALGVGYMFKDSFDASGMAVIYFGVLLSLIIMGVMFPHALKQKDLKKKSQWMIRMVLLESAVLWGCVIYFILGNMH